MNIRLVCGWECLFSERHFKFKTLLVGHSYYLQMCPTINIGPTEFFDFLLAYICILDKFTFWQKCEFSTVQLVYILMARYVPGEAGGAKGRCVGSLWVTLGLL